jgi:DNA-binding NarL/FixJ family response regulator
LHLTLDEQETAADCFTQCPDGSPEAIAGLIESMALAGRETEARAVLSAYSGDVSVPPVSVARCLLDKDPAAARQVVRHADAAPSAFEAARWRFLTGFVLRRSGARREAREQLRLAEAVFEDLGASAWGARVRSELKASGETLRKGPEGQSLTPGELRVATLVAEGRSNKEVAAALFLSTKTVEFHLARAFRKLGVSNRTALSARIGDRRLD